MNDQQLAAWDASQAPIDEIAISVTAALNISVTDTAVNANTYIITGSYSGTFTFPREAFLPDARYDDSVLDNETFQVCTGETEVGQPAGKPPFFRSLACRVLTAPEDPVGSAQAYLTKGTGTVNISWQQNHATNPPANTSGTDSFTPTINVWIYRNANEVQWGAFFSPWVYSAMPPEAWQGDWPFWTSSATSSAIEIDVTTLKKLTGGSVDIGATFSSTNPATPDAGDYSTGSWNMVVDYAITCT